MLHLFVPVFLQAKSALISYFILTPEQVTLASISSVLQAEQTWTIVAAGQFYDQLK
jgi:hypothetical protein